MTAGRSALVNRQLSQAHAVAKSLRDLAPGQATRVLARALEESLLFQLVLGYRRFLAEIGEKLGATSPAGYLTAAELAAHLEAKGMPAPVLWECRRLEDEGWIGQMLHEFEQCWQSSEPDAPRKHDAKLIARSAAGSRTEAAAVWLASLEKLIEQLREALSEW